MAEDRDALLEHYRRMREELLSAVDGLSDELMTERSLDGWSVKDHLAHLALWDDIRASEVVRISAGHDSAWRMTGDQDGIYSALGHSLRLSPCRSTRCGGSWRRRGRGCSTRSRPRPRGGWMRRSTAKRASAARMRRPTRHGSSAGGGNEASRLQRTHVRARAA